MLIERVIGYDMPTMASIPVANEGDIYFAHALADAAGAAIRPFYRAYHRGAIALEKKADNTPVTVADRVAERAMRALLAKHRPRDALIGEEYGAEYGGGGAPERGGLDAPRLWVLDPIDGTLSFIAGRPIFGTLIALLVEGVPVLGIIDQPISGERWVGAIGHSTVLNGQPVRSRACNAMSMAVLATTAPQYFDVQQGRAFARLTTRAGGVVYGGDCYNYGLLALGSVDMVCEAGLKLYDFAALVPIVAGAGGLICDWQGHALTSASGGDILALGDPTQRDVVLEILAE